jgi:hypothetical protein
MGCRSADDRNPWQDLAQQAGRSQGEAGTESIVRGNAPFADEEADVIGECFDNVHQEGGDFNTEVQASLYRIEGQFFAGGINCRRFALSMDNLDLLQYRVQYLLMGVVTAIS